jgi:hypothetical protein
MNYLQFFKKYFFFLAWNSLNVKHPIPEENNEEVSE